MAQKPNGVRVYNVLFPVYMIFLFFPATWLVILPFNFAFDSLVLWLAMRHWQMQDKKGLWKKSILRVWLFGFTADLAGAGLIVLLYFVTNSLMDFTDFTTWEPLLVLPCVALAGWLIYLLDKKWAFGKTALDAVQRHKLALALAIFTAPYTMLIPTRLLYRF